MVVLNPGKPAIIYTSTKKTDKEDALKIARLFESMPEEYLPLVPLPSEAEEEMRRLASSQEYILFQSSFFSIPQAVRLLSRRPRPESRARCLEARSVCSSPASSLTLRFGVEYSNY